MSREWKVGKSQKQGLQKKQERAIILGVYDSNKLSEEIIQDYIGELTFLSETAGAAVVKTFIQKMPHPNRKYYVGTGKLEEIQAYIESGEVDVVLIDDDITAKQQQILEEHLKRKIIDRSSLILDIFASRAQTAQSKTQVELAQMQYLLPRLRGLWTHLERQRGGIGMRGPGEQEIETDRRIVRDKISMLKKRLEKIDRQNLTQRKNRGAMIRAALVGYTNAGKSTLMNTLSKSDVFAENKLFATLDTTVRKVVFENMPFLLSDTVGFIRKLPHHLIESFKSTLDEAKESDLLLHVVDLSHPNYESHIHTVQKTLLDLGAGEIRTLLVCNKIDQYRAKYFDDLLETETKAEIEAQLLKSLQDTYDAEVLFISAKTGEGIDALKNRMQEIISGLYGSRYPYKKVFY